MKKTFFEYIVPIYEVGVEIYLCDYEKLPSYIRDDDPHNDKGYEGFTVNCDQNGKSRRFIVWCHNFNWTSSNMATLVHELSHVTDKIAEYKSITLDTESRAYLLGHLVEVFFRKIGKEYK